MQATQDGISQGFIEDLSNLARRIAAPEPPQHVPSAPECRFCDITAADCPERIETATEPEAATTNDF